MLLDRYGILFRELLQRELPPFRWGSPLQSPCASWNSPAKYSPAASSMASRACNSSPRPPCNGSVNPCAKDAIYWMHVSDPASLCGLNIEGLRDLPERRSGTHLVHHGQKLVLVSKAKGKNLQINVPPDDENLSHYYAPFQNALTRQFMPENRYPYRHDQRKKPPGRAFMWTPSGGISMRLSREGG